MPFVVVFRLFMLTSCLSFIFQELPLFAVAKLLETGLVNLAGVMAASQSSSIRGKQCS